jgi:hypothetical protein
MEARTTQGYTHLITADDQRTAAELGRIICLNLPKNENDLKADISQVIQTQ